MEPADKGTVRPRTRLNVDELLPPRYEMELPATTGQGSPHSSGQPALATEEFTPKLLLRQATQTIKVGGRERLLRRLSPEERRRRRRIFNVVMFLAGGLLLILAAAMLMRR